MAAPISLFDSRAAYFVVGSVLLLCSHILRRILSANLPETKHVRSEKVRPAEIHRNNVVPIRYDAFEQKHPRIIAKAGSKRTATV